MLSSCSLKLHGATYVLACATRGLHTKTLSASVVAVVWPGFRSPLLKLYGGIVKDSGWIYKPPSSFLHLSVRTPLFARCNVASQPSAASQKTSSARRLSWALAAAVRPRVSDRCKSEDLDC